MPVTQLVRGQALEPPIQSTENSLRGCAPARTEDTSLSPGVLRRPEDEELMIKLRARNPDALGELCERYSRFVMGIAFRILRDVGEAEDTVQETFFYLYRKAGAFDPAKGSAKAWILQVAYHRAVDRKLYLRRRGFYLSTEIDSVLDTMAGPTDLDREIDAVLNRSQLEQAFADLPEVQRRTLEMFYFDGLELREIAAALNEALGNVRHYYYRGLERLRRSAFVGVLDKTCYDARR